MAEKFEIPLRAEEISERLIMLKSDGEGNKVLKDNGKYDTIEVTIPCDLNRETYPISKDLRNTIIDAIQNSKRIAFIHDEETNIPYVNECVSSVIIGNDIILDFSPVRKDVDRNEYSALHITINMVDENPEMIIQRNELWNKSDARLAITIDSNNTIENGITGKDILNAYNDGSNIVVNGYPASQIKAVTNGVQLEFMSMNIWNNGSAYQEDGYPKVGGKLLLNRYTFPLSSSTATNVYKGASLDSDYLLTNLYKSKIKTIKTEGKGTKFLSDDGTYKEIKTSDISIWRSDIEGGFPILTEATSSEDLSSDMLINLIHNMGKLLLFKVRDSYLFCTEQIAEDGGKYSFYFSDNTYEYELSVYYEGIDADLVRFLVKKKDILIELHLMGNSLDEDSKLSLSLLINLPSLINKARINWYDDNSQLSCHSMVQSLEIDSGIVTLSFQIISEDKVLTKKAIIDMSNGTYTTGS